MGFFEPDDRPRATRREATLSEREPSSGAGAVPSLEWAGFAGPLGSLELEGRRVFIRVDLDLALDSAGKLVEPDRLRSILPTVRLAREQRARVIIAGHRFARPGEGGASTPSAEGDGIPSIEPIAVELASMLEGDVIVPDDCLSDAAKRVVMDLRAGEVCVLENLAWHEGEVLNDAEFAARLASYVDIYVNDAPSLMSCSFASLVELPLRVETRAVGELLRAELSELGRLGRVHERLGVLIASETASEVFDIHRLVGERAGVIVVSGAAAQTLACARSGREPVSTDALSSPSELALARSLLQDLDRDRVPYFLGPHDPAGFRERELASAQAILVLASSGLAGSLIASAMALAAPARPVTVAVWSEAKALVSDVIAPPGVFISQAGENVLRWLSRQRMPALEALRPALAMDPGAPRVDASGIL